MGADNHPVRKLINDIVNSKEITAHQVALLEDFTRNDWHIDQNESLVLFQVNQALGSNYDDCPEWDSFFSHAITRLVVFDMNTPGQVDAVEGDWLNDMLNDRAVGNRAEDKLLTEIKKFACSINGKISERLANHSPASNM